MSAREFQKNIANFCETLLVKDLALAFQAHTIDRLADGVSRVTWASNLDRDKDKGREGYARTLDLELAEYLRCLRVGDYSILLNDGSLIQAQIDFRGDVVVGSRLCYIPCLIKFDIEEIRLDTDIYPLEDFILELPQQELLSRLCIRAPFRFEHDALNAAEDHATDHVHLGKSQCRVPVASLVCWDHFARFVFKNFYPEQFDIVAELLKFPVSHRPRSITDALSLEVHFSFDFPKLPQFANKKPKKKNRRR